MVRLRASGARDLGSNPSNPIVFIVSSSIIFVNGILNDINRIRKDRRLMRDLIVIILITAIVSYFVSTELKSVFQIQRPCVDLAGCQGGFSFPSTQTTMSFGAAAAVALLVGRKYATVLLYIIASLVGISRILLDQHSLYDVLGGVAFGTATGFAIYFLFKKIVASMTSRK